MVGEAVLVQAHLQTGVAEEGVDVPGGRPIHGYQPPALRRDFQHPVQGQDVPLGKVSFVIIKEIAVVRRQGVGVKHAVHTGRLHGGGEVCGPDGVGVCNGVQSPGGGQGGHLIVGKGKDIRAALQVPQQGILAVRLALGLKGDVKIRLPGVVGLEGGEHLLEQGFILLCAPDGQTYGLLLRDGALRRRRLVLAGGEE